MKILVVIPSYKPAYSYGGPIRSVAALCESLVKQGCKVKVLTTNANGNENLNVTLGVSHNVDGVEVIYHARWTKDHSNFSPGLLKSILLNKSNYDVIHFHSWWNLVTMPGMVLGGKKKGGKILSPRGSITSFTMLHQKARIKKWYHSIIGKNILKSCSFHVTSDLEMRDVKSLVRTDSVFVIPNILELPKVVQAHTDNDKVFRLLYLGRIDPKKNLEFLFDVLMKSFAVPYTLEIIGDGEQAYIDSLKKMTRNSVNILWSNSIHSNLKWIKYAEADLLVLPSLNENYGNVILESLSQGTAVLISDQVGLKDYVIQKQLGWVTENNVDLWSKSLEEIWHDKAARMSIRQKAPYVIQNDFCPEVLVDQYIKMYLSVVSTN